MEPKKEKDKNLSWHINEFGLSNEIVHNLVSRMTKNSEQYLGVFSFSKIPKQKVLTAAAKNNDKNVVMIINIGQHFVTLVISHDAVIYIDSYARSIPDTKHVLSLLKELTEAKEDQQRRQLFINTTPIQHPTSTHCGLYAALFTVWYLANTKARMKLHFDSQHLLLNDDLCVQYLKQFIRGANKN